MKRTCKWTRGGFTKSARRPVDQTTPLGSLLLVGAKRINFTSLMVAPLHVTRRHNNKVISGQIVAKVSFGWPKNGLLFHHCGNESVALCVRKVHGYTCIFSLKMCVSGASCRKQTVAGNKAPGVGLRC